MADRIQTLGLTVGQAAYFRVSFADDQVALPGATMTMVSGALPPGISNATGDRYLIGTPLVAGSYVSSWQRNFLLPDRTVLTLNVVAAPTSGGGSGSGSGSGSGAGQTTTVRLTWFQARAEALAGVRIRRAGWVDKYVEYDRGIWFLQPVSPTTKVLGVRRVVRATDWSDQEFRAVDWTYEGILGQSASPGAAAAIVDPALRFP